MSSYEVQLIFEDGVYSYQLPHIFSISDPKEGMKATVIGGTRSSGSIVIPGGKKSQTITVRGRLFNENGYADLTSDMNTLRSSITTDPATLTLKHKEGISWTNDWQYVVRRISEIRFPESLRLDEQEYEISFLVLSY